MVARKKAPPPILQQLPEFWETRMKLLHLSDLHLKFGKYDQNIVLQAFQSHMAANSAEFQNIDLVIFSGDLVYSGGANADFERFQDEVVKKIQAVIPISEDRFIVCPGNHDIDREVVRADAYIESGLLKTLSSSQAINSFIDQHVKAPLSAVPPALNRLANFYEAVWSKAERRFDTCNPFFATKTMTVDGATIGIAVLNSAWRTTGEPDDIDRGNLIIGERAVDLAHEAISDCEVKLAVFHHPLDWLRPYDRLAVERRLYANFDMLFYGHVHLALPERRTSIMGEAIISQGPCLYSSRDWFNGFSIIDVDLGNATATFKLWEYVDERRVFRPAERVADNGLFSLHLRNSASPASKFAAALRLAGPRVKEIATRHINLVGNADQPIDIDSHYVCPPLSKKTEASELVSEEESESIDDAAELKELLEATGDIVVSGKPQDGKTSLAHFIAYKCSIGWSDRPRLPIICNFDTVSNKRTSSWKVALWPMLRGYAGEVLDIVSKSDIEKFDLLVIVDDVDIDDSARIDMLLTLKKTHTNIRWVFLSKSDALSLVRDKQTKNTFENATFVAIRNLTRNNIRALSAGWVGKPADDDDTQEIFQKLMFHMARNGLPRTGYIVTLLLWVIKNVGQGELLNEAVLLENVLDYILGRMDYRGALRKEFDYTSKNHVLQDIAFWLKTSPNGKSKNALVAHVSEYLDERLLPYDGADMVNGFINCGVLESTDGVVKFKFSRYQDYFVAGYIRDHDDVRNIVLSNGDEWLRYSGEVDIYTSRFRQELPFLSMADQELRKHLIPLANLPKEEVDKFFVGAPPSDYTAKQLKRIRSRRLNARQIDEIMDRAEQKAVDRVSAKKAAAGTTNPLFEQDTADDHVQFGKLLVTYSQVIRNLEFIRAKDKEKHIRQALQLWSSYCVFWIDAFQNALVEIRNDLLEEPKLNDQEKDTLPNLMEKVGAVIKTVISSIICQIAYINLGTEKILKLLIEIAGDTSLDRIERFLVFSLILEIDPEKALSVVQSWGKFKDLDRWSIAAVTQQLYSYYNSRPLPSQLATRFENIVAELELAVEKAGEPQRAAKKPLIINAIRQHQFKEDGTEAGE